MIINKPQLTWKKNFFSKLKNKHPDDEALERTKGIEKNLNIKFGEEILHLYLKIDVLLPTCVTEKFIKVSIIEFDFNPFSCVSRPTYSYQCRLKYTDIKLKYT